MIKNNPQHKARDKGVHRETIFGCNRTLKVSIFSLFYALKEERKAYQHSLLFKPFNDYYGYSRGDRVIKEIAKLILNSVEKCGNKEDFVGHIGGDDFIIITTPEKVGPISTEIFDGLAKVSKRLYKDEDILRGYFEIEDRRGEIKRFSTRFGLTIAGVTNLKVQFENHLAVSDRLAELKHFGKAQGGSLLVMDRRE